MSRTRTKELKAKSIARVTYRGFTRYWVFGKKFVDKVYDQTIVDGEYVVERNTEAEWTFDDMDRDELEAACKRDHYWLYWFDKMPPSFTNKRP